MWARYAVGLLLLLVLAAAPYGEAETEARRAHGRSLLTVVMDDTYPPYVFRNSSGVLDGYLVDLWKLWESKTGVRVDLVATDWQKAQQLMAAGHADVIDTIFQTREREKTLDFTLPYARVPVMIYSDAGISGITNTDALRGFSVGVKAGDACIGKLKDSGVASLQEFASYEALVAAAVAGQVRVFCLDEPPANYLLYRRHAERDFNKTFRLYSGALHRAVHKGDTVTLALVNEGFAAITADEQQDLHDKWMGSRLDVMPYGRYLGNALLIVALTGILLAAWGAALRRRVRQRTAQLEDERARLRVLLETIPDLVWLKDEAGVFLFCNPPFERLFGAKEAQIVGKTDYDFVDREQAEFFREHDRMAQAAGQPTSNEEWITFAGGGHRALVETTRTPMYGARGQLIGVLGIARDITERKATEEEVRRLAFYDTLTQLPNRRLLVDRLQQAIAASVRRGKQVAVLFIDLDNFKLLNDTLGHGKGDLLLRQVARRLEQCVREEDTVARLGGDEFVVVLNGLSGEAFEGAAHAESVGGKILVELARPYDLDGHEITSTPSIGITLLADRETTFDELMKRADMAMYQAKGAGRNTLRFFDPQMQAAVAARIGLEGDLREGLKHGQFLLHYQPQVDGNGAVTGAEALVRWQHPLRGLIFPSDFIPLAEETGLILPLGAWVMTTACNQLVDWAGDPATAHFALAINVSARQFRQPDFVEQVSATLEASGADPTKLKLELTESLLLDNVEDTIVKMAALRNGGVSFSLDDFGTGYSSLSYLKRLSLDQVKIDQTFVRDVLSDPDDAAIARTIVALAQNLGLSVIAEGVETDAQREFLAVSGCHACQGYLFGAPMLIEEFGRFVGRK